MTPETRAARLLLKTAPAALERAADRMSAVERRNVSRELEHLARYAAFLGVYLSERHGYGCGDQGHRSAVKKANSAARKLWTKVLGYYAFHDYNI